MKKIELIHAIWLACEELSMFDFEPESEVEKEFITLTESVIRQDRDYLTALLDYLESYESESDSVIDTLCDLQTYINSIPRVCRSTRE